MSIRPSWTALWLAVVLPGDRRRARRRSCRTSKSSTAPAMCSRRCARPMPPSQPQPRAAQMRFLKGVMLSDLKRDATRRCRSSPRLTQDFPELPDPYNNLAVLVCRRWAAAKRVECAADCAAQRSRRTGPRARTSATCYLALAQQAWAQAQAGSKGDDAELRRKLRLAREIQAGADGAPTARARLAVRATQAKRRAFDVENELCAGSCRPWPALLFCLAANGSAWAQKVRLDTSLGEIVIELDAAKAPKSVANFLAVRQGRPLRRHDLPPRHPQLHDPGRRLRLPT